MSASAATSRAYALLSRLLLDGVNAATAERISEVAYLSEALEEVASLDVLAAEHYALFALEVPPHEGVFVDEQGLIGGEHAARLSDVYRASGFVAQRRDVSVDHLGVTLGALAFLTGASADASEDGEHQRAKDIDSRILLLLDDHLLSWLPAYAVAALPYAHGFWRLVIELTLELVAAHRGALGPLPTSVSPLAVPVRLLDDDATNLRRIAAYLTTASFAGIFMSRSDIAMLGRSVSIPRGFGSRVNMLESLLRGAAEYDSFPAVLDDVNALLESRQVALGQLAKQYPSFSPFAAPWAEALSDCSAVVRALQSRARAARVAPAHQQAGLERQTG